MKLVGEIKDGSTAAIDFLLRLAKLLACMEDCDVKIEKGLSAYACTFPAREYIDAVHKHTEVYKKVTDIVSHRHDDTVRMIFDLSNYKSKISIERGIGIIEQIKPSHYVFS